jgi:hypothetical protein
MAIDLLRATSHFRAVNDRESETAYFRTHVPWVAPLAYLNIIFKPPAPDVLQQAAEELRIPRDWEDFLKLQNGALLFSDDLYMYGVLRPGQLLNREDGFRRLPWNIDDADRESSPDRDRLLVIGGYGYDCTHVCVDRKDGRVYAFKRRQRRPIFSWPNTVRWVRDETARISCLFDETGRRLADEAETLPRLTQ